MCVFVLSLDENSGLLLLLKFLFLLLFFSSWQYMSTFATVISQVDLDN